MSGFSTLRRMSFRISRMLRRWRKAEAGREKGASQGTGPHPAAASLRHQTSGHGGPGAGTRPPSGASPSAPGATGGISRTSQAVALTRARMDRPHSPDGDPSAQARLCRGMRPAPATRLRPMLTARTRFFDEQVLAAIAAGIRQVVICGAGYDDRALRFRTRRVRFFELDQGPTQADKGRRLREMEADLDALTLVRADFRHDDVAALLGGAGHDAARPSLFICEGLLVYLGQPTIVRLLAGLASRAAPGSVLAASLAVHADGRNSAEVAAAANARRRAGRTEPWRTIFPVGTQLDLLRSTGWQPDQTADAAALEPAAPAGRTLLITARPAGPA
jgi:methyltransferase (TIGR00027 family)